MTERDPQHDARQLEDAVERGYQPDNTSIRAVTIFIAILTGAVIVVMIVIQLLIAGFDAVREEAPPPAFETSSELPPRPRLQEKPIDDLDELRAYEQRMLDSYGWVDREQGVVRMPIERAMKLMVEEAEATEMPSDEGNATNE